jgi:hypothetical protein
MKGKDVFIDLISRTVIVLIYVFGSQIITACVKVPFNSVVEIFT